MVMKIQTSSGAVYQKLNAELHYLYPYMDHVLRLAGSHEDKDSDVLL